MALKDKVVNLVIRGKNLFSGTADEAGDSLESLGKRTRELKSELDKLEKTDKVIKNFGKQKYALTEAESAYQQSTKAVSELARELSKTEEPTKGMVREFERAKKVAAGAKNEFQKQRVALEQSRRAITDMGSSSNKLSDAQRKLKNRQEEVNAALRKTREEAARKALALKNANKVIDDARGKVSSLNRTIIASAAAFFGLRAMVSNVKTMFTVGDKFERLESQVTALMGSIEGGKEATAWIKEFARDTPLQLEEVTSIFVKLKAFGLDPMNGTMKSVVDQAYKLGGSFQEVEGIALAVGQAWAKQKLQGEEILQLIERGVPVWDLLAKVTGKNTQELQSMVSAGELGRDTIKALMDEMGAQSTGAAATGMSQLSGLISNAKDNIADFYNQVATSGSLDWLKGQLADLNAEFKAMSDDGRLKKLAQEISDWLVRAGEAIKRTVAIVYEWRGAIVNVAKAWAALKILSMIRDVGLLAGAIKTKLIANLAATTAAMGTATGAAGKLRVALMLIPGAGWASAIITGLGALTYGGYKAAQSIGELNKQIEAGSKVEEKQRNFWRETIKQNEAIADSLREYRDLKILTAEQVAELDKKEQAAYKEKLQRHRDYLESQLMIKTSHEQLGSAVLASHIKVDKGIKQMLQGFKDLEQGMQDSAGRIRNEVNPSIAAMTNEFSQAIAEGKKVDEAMRSAFKGIDLTVTQDVNRLVGSLVELRKGAQITGEDISRYLGGSLSRLSTNELLELKSNAASAFTAISGGAKESARVVEQITGEAYRRLGLSLQEVRTGISEADEQVIGSFRLIASDAKATAAELETAFLAAVGRITSEKGLGELGAVWEKVTEQGRVSIETSSQHMDALGQKIIETKLKAADIGNGFAQSKDGVQELVDSIYKMADSGQFSAEQIQQHLAGALDNLSGEELERFKIALIDTFNAGESHALKLAGVMDDVTTAAFKRLGLSLQEIRTGIDETGADVLAAFNVIASDANATSAEIAAAFKAAAGRLDTEQELKLLRDAFRKSAKQAGMSSEEMRRALMWLDEKIQQTAEHTKSIGDGYDTAADAAEKSAQRQILAQQDVQKALTRTHTLQDSASNNVRGNSGQSDAQRRLEEKLRKKAEIDAVEEAALNRRKELLGTNNGSGEVVTLRFEGANGSKGGELTGSKEQVERMIDLLKQQGMRTS